MSDYRSYVPNSPDGLFFNYGQGALPVNLASPPQSQTTEYLGTPGAAGYLPTGGDPTDSGGAPTGFAHQATATVGGGLLSAITGKPSVMTSISNATKSPTSENIAAAIQAMIGVGVSMAVPPAALFLAIPAIATKLGLNGPTSGTVAPGQNSTNNAKADLGRILPPPLLPPKVTPPDQETAPAGANGATSGPGAGAPGPSGGGAGGAPGGAAAAPSAGPGTSGPGTSGPGNTGPGTTGPGAGGTAEGPGAATGPGPGAAAAAAAAASAAAAATSAPADAAPANSTAAPDSGNTSSTTGPGTGGTTGGGAGSGPGGGGEAGEGNSGGTGGGSGGPGTGGTGPGGSGGPAGAGPAGPGSEGTGPSGEGEVARGGRITYDKFKSKQPRPIWHTEQAPEYAHFKDGGAARRPLRAPQRNAFEDIWSNPRTIAEDAARNTAPEDPAMKQLWGYDRDALYEAYKDRVGNKSGEDFLRPSKGTLRGSAAAYNIMTPGNAQRLVDTLSEAQQRAPELTKGMHVWYAMDPVERRLIELKGEDAGANAYNRFNHFTGAASPMSEVLTELHRGTAANTLANQGRLGDFENYGNLPSEMRERVKKYPADMMSIPGVVPHANQVSLMRKFNDTGDLDTASPKVPLYIGASSTPRLGFQSDTPVPDSHFSRGVGMADTRTDQEWARSMKMPELRTMAPWFRENVAEPVGIEAVPAQARLWGTLGHITGVDTPVGAPKLELLSQHIMRRAHDLGMSPWEARDAIISGEAFARGGVAHQNHMM